MFIPKPQHLGPEHAEHFKDASVVEAYVNHPPYPGEVFDILHCLITDEPRTVLDMGCGTGEIARLLAAMVDRVDAVDMSPDMISTGRRRDGGSRKNIKWMCQSAEDFAYQARYSLIVAGASLHWTDWHVVLPRMGRSLSRRGFLAIVGGRVITAPWIDDLNSNLPRYSTNKDFAPYNLIEELERRDLFSVVGRKRTSPREHQMSVDQYVEVLHARNGFSRERMEPHLAADFDAFVRQLVAPFASGGIVAMEVVSDVTWGHPATHASTLAGDSP